MHGNMTPNKKQKTRSTIMRDAFINSTVNWSTALGALTNAVQSGINRKLGVRPLASKAGAQ